MTTRGMRNYLYLDSMKVLIGYAFFFFFVVTILYRSAVYLGSPISLLVHLLLVYVFLLYRGLTPRKDSFMLIHWAIFWLSFALPVMAAAIPMSLRAIGALSGSRVYYEYAQLAFGVHDFLDVIFRFPWHINY